MKSTSALNWDRPGAGGGGPPDWLPVDRDDEWYAEQEEDAVEHGKNRSPQYPLRYRPPQELEEEEDPNEDAFLEDYQAAQAQQEQDIIDWIFKCVTITLLTLILVCVIIILVKVWSVNATIDPSSLSASTVKGFGQSSGALGVSSSGKYDPRNVSEDPYRSSVTSSSSNRLWLWMKTTGLGRTAYQLVSFPAWLIRSCVTIILAPLRFLFSRLMYFAYICAFMLGLVMIFYWVIHAFLTQTLGEWFMTRLRLPAPRQLVHDFAVFIGYGFFNRWWSLTELIKEKAISYFNTVMDQTPYGSSNWGGTGMGLTPGPMRRRSSLWGRPLGVGPRGASIGSNRNSLHFPKSNVYTGVPSVDQKRRLQTINETTLTGQQNIMRAGYRANNGLSNSFTASSLDNKPILTNRIHTSPPAALARDPYSFDNFDKENDTLRPPQSFSNKTSFSSTFGNANVPGGNISTTGAFSNPLILGSPRRPLNANQRMAGTSQPKFGGHAAARQAQRLAQRQQTGNSGGAGSGGLGGMRSKKGIAFNVG